MSKVMPDGYATAIAALDRQVAIYLTLGTDINTTAADDIISISGSMLPMSNTAQVTDAIYEIFSGLATFEGDGIPTAVSNGLIAPPLSAQDYPPEVGIWSDAISDANGSILWTFSIALSSIHTSAFRIYTDGPSITSASCTFSDGTSTETIEMECTAEHATATGSHTYNSISVTITGISDAYHHIRIVECEFGASRSIAGSETMGEATLIDELDPTEQTMPVRELDFSLINVDGTYDPDNPVGRLPELGIGYPISLSYTILHQGVQYTVPMGRFIIGERSAEDTAIRITAFDARYKLSEIVVSWSISSSASFGTSLDALLKTYDIAHSIDEDLFSFYPEESNVFDEETTLLEDLLRIQQAYAIYFIPDRDGTIHVTQTWPAGTALAVPLNGIFAWPSAKQVTRYNFVSVAYTSGDTTLYVEQDMRSDPAETKTVLQIVNNPLVRTRERAAAIKNRIVERLKLDTIEVDWVGDPSMDVGDSIAVPGRWSQDAPPSYVVTSRELTFDVGLRDVTRASR